MIVFTFMEKAHSDWSLLLFVLITPQSHILPVTTILINNSLLCIWLLLIDTIYYKEISGIHKYEDTIQHPMTKGK